MLDLVASDLDMQLATPAVDKAIIAARAGLGLLCEYGVTHAELREAVFNGFRNHEEAVDNGFDMSHGSRCILGRAVGDYTRGAELLGLSSTHTTEQDNRNAVNHGFLVLRVGEIGYDEDLDNDYDYGDLAQAWERILVPEWWAIPKTFTMRVELDVTVLANANLSKVAYGIRDLVSLSDIDQGQPSREEWTSTSLYTWDIIPEEEQD